MHQKRTVVLLMVVFGVLVISSVLASGFALASTNQIGNLTCSISKEGKADARLILGSGDVARQTSSAYIVAERDGDGEPDQWTNVAWQAGTTGTASLQAISGHSVSYVLWVTWADTGSSQNVNTCIAGWPVVPTPTPTTQPPKARVFMPVLLSKYSTPVFVESFVHPGDVYYVVPNTHSMASLNQSFSHYGFDASWCHGAWARKEGVGSEEYQLFISDRCSQWAVINLSDLPVGKYLVILDAYGSVGRGAWLEVGVLDKLLTSNPQPLTKLAYASFWKEFSVPFEIKASAGSSQTVNLYVKVGWDTGEFRAGVRNIRIYRTN